MVGSPEVRPSDSGALLTNVRVVTFGADGTIEDGFVRISNGKISAVGEMSQLDEGWSGREDLSGYTVMPGLINSHMHFEVLRTIRSWNPGESISRQAFRGVRSALNCLREGVTTARDLGHNDHMRLELREAIAQGVIRGPRAIVAGEALSMSYGHASWVTVSVRSIDELTHEVRRQIQDGANVIKLITSHEDLSNPGGDQLAVAWMPKSAIQAAVETAHAAGLPVAAHANGREAIGRCLDSGVDTIEHGVYLDEELSARMAATGTVLVPTLSGIRETGDARWGGRLPLQRYRDLWRVHRETIHHAVAAKVRILVGTDTVGTMADEIDLLRQAGMTPDDTLRAATIDAATAFGIEEVTGSIDLGKQADLVVVRGDPWASIAPLRNVERVYIGGVALSADLLRLMVPSCPGWGAGW